MAALDAGAQGNEASNLRQGLLDCVHQLAGNLEDAQHLLAALGGVAAKLAEPSPGSAAALSCLHAAASSLVTHPPFYHMPSKFSSLLYQPLWPA